MVKTTNNARELAERLISQHAEMHSWRRVADCYPGVTFQVLNRIALSEGEWLPKERKILQALGLVKARQPRTKIQKAIDGMARETRKAVLKRK